MARLLFIENRGKTHLWERVAAELARAGHQVAWIVQNPQYTPAPAAGVRVHVLPFPQSLQAGADAGEFPELATDRGRRYFGAGSAHYGHYRTRIAAVLDAEQPDAVIGEPTLFHELIAIGLCRARGIPYLHPCANRYPGGRFSVLSHDTQISLGGSGERLDPSEALALAQRIASGQVVPAYMRGLNLLPKLQRTLKLVKARGGAWRGYLAGERYNTPSLRTKWRLTQQLRRNLARWQELQSVPSGAGKTLLYPLQMQPEANLDVWGREYADQVAVVRGMLDAGPPDLQVAVKANPKSKYEVSDELLALASAEPRVCLLPLDMKMADAQALTVGTLTVTGTVGLEAVLGRGRALSLGHPVIQTHFPSLHADSIADGVGKLLHEPAAGVGSAEMGAELLQHLVQTSYRGVVSEPLYDARCIEPDNVAAVAKAIKGLLGERAHLVQEA